jgi:hypothetical protein
MVGTNGNKLGFLAGYRKEKYVNETIKDCKVEKREISLKLWAKIFIGLSEVMNINLTISVSTD